MRNIKNILCYGKKIWIKPTHKNMNYFFFLVYSTKQINGNSNCIQAHNVPLVWRDQRRTWTGKAGRYRDDKCPSFGAGPPRHNTIRSPLCLVSPWQTQIVFLGSYSLLLVYIIVHTYLRFVALNIGSYGRKYCIRGLYFIIKIRGSISGS